MIPRIPLPKGFTASGINSGVHRRYRPDLGDLFSQRPCSAAGVFTRNSLKAAPVTYCQALLPSGSIRAIVVNEWSGQCRHRRRRPPGIYDDKFHFAMLESDLCISFALHVSLPVCFNSICGDA